MKLRSQKIELNDTVRVEIGFVFEPPQFQAAPDVSDGPLAVLAYDDPQEALRDACSFVETALAAVRHDAARARTTDERLRADWARMTGAKP